MLHLTLTKNSIGSEEAGITVWRDGGQVRLKVENASLGSPGTYEMHEANTSSDPLEVYRKITHHELLVERDFTRIEDQEFKPRGPAMQIAV